MLGFIIPKMRRKILSLRVGVSMERSFNCHKWEAPLHAQGFLYSGITKEDAQRTNYVGFWGST